MSTQPKPRKQDAASPTGEQIADAFYKPVAGLVSDQVRKRELADMINAALVEEWSNTDHKRKIIKEQAEKLLQLREQLAAAVDYWQGVATQEWHKGFASGTEQLATEREKCDRFLRDLKARLVPSLTSSSDHTIINDIDVFLEENDDEISIVEGPTP